MISTKKLCYKICQKIAELENATALIDKIYPVGSYYETSDADFNPNVTWGGTWSLEAEGLVHIGSGTNYTLGATGGESTHLLTSAESGLPSHTHTQAQHRHTLATDWSSGTGSSEAYTMQNNRSAGATRYTNYQTPTINSNTAADASTAHNNMQPYIVVNRWHRTA